MSRYEADAARATRRASPGAGRDARGRRGRGRAPARARGRAAGWCPRPRCARAPLPVPRRRAAGATGCWLRSAQGPVTLAPGDAFLVVQRADHPRVPDARRAAQDRHRAARGGLPGAPAPPRRRARRSRSTRSTSSSASPRAARPGSRSRPGSTRSRRRARARLRLRAAAARARPRGARAGAARSPPRARSPPPRAAARARAGALVLDNLAQFRFYSGCLAAVERRAAQGAPRRLATSAARGSGFTPAPSGVLGSRHAERAARASPDPAAGRGAAPRLRARLARGPAARAGRRQRRSHLPLRVEVFRAWQRGEVPSWNGVDLLRDAAARLLPPGRAAPADAGARSAAARSPRSRLLVLVSLALTGPLAYLYARRLGAGPVGALTTGLGFALGPHLVAHLGDTATIVAAPALPLLLLAAESQLARPRRAHAATLGLAAAVALVLLVRARRDAVLAAALLLGARLAARVPAAAAARRRPRDRAACSPHRSRRSSPACCSRRRSSCRRSWRCGEAGAGGAGAAYRRGRAARGRRGLRRALRVALAGADLRARLGAAAAQRPGAARRGRRGGAGAACCSPLRGGPDVRRPAAARLRPRARGARGPRALGPVAARREPLGRRRAAASRSSPRSFAAAALSIATTVTGPLAPELQAPVGLLALALVLHFALAGSRDSVYAHVFLLPLVVSFLLQPLGRQAWAGAPTLAELAAADADARRARPRDGRARATSGCCRSARLAARARARPRLGQPGELLRPPQRQRLRPDGARRAARGARRHALRTARPRASCSRPTPGGWSCSACAGSRCRRRRWRCRATRTASASRSTWCSSRRGRTSSRCRSRAPPRCACSSFLAGAVDVEDGRGRGRVRRAARLGARDRGCRSARASRRRSGPGTAPTCAASVRHARPRVHATFTTGQGVTGQPVPRRAAAAGRASRCARCASAPCRARRRCGWCGPGSTTPRPRARIGVSTAAAFVSDEVRLAEAAGTPLVSLFEVRRGIGPAWVVESLRRLPDAARVLDVLRAPTRLGVDTRREAIAARGRRARRRAAAGQPLPGGGRGAAPRAGGSWCARRGPGCW